MTNNVEIDANVYSVVSIRSEDVDRVCKAYLYDSTVVEVAFDLPGIVRRTSTAVVLKTTATAQYCCDDDLAATTRSAVNRAGQLAQNQVDRFASGLYPGRVCGSLHDATEYVLSLS